VAESFLALTGMDVGRIRVCENPGCQWYFYDETRSRTKRCCDETCANLVKVRRHRARKKERPKSASGLGAKEEALREP